MKVLHLHLYPQIPFDVVSLKFKKEEIRLEMIPAVGLQRYNTVVQALEKAAKGTCMQKALRMESTI